MLESLGDVNMHFIRGIAFKSGPDKPRRDPDVAEIYIYTQKGTWIHSETIRLEFQDKPSNILKFKIKPCVTNKLLINFMNLKIALDEM